MSPTCLSHPESPIKLNRRTRCDRRDIISSLSLSLVTPLLFYCILGAHALARRATVMTAKIRRDGKEEEVKSVHLSFYIAILGLSH